MKSQHSIDFLLKLNTLLILKINMWKSYIKKIENIKSDDVFDYCLKFVELFKSELNLNILNYEDFYSLVYDKQKSLFSSEFIDMGDENNVNLNLIINTSYYFNNLNLNFLFPILNSDKFEYHQIFNPNDKENEFLTNLNINFTKILSKNFKLNTITFLFFYFFPNINFKKYIKSFIYKYNISNENFDLLYYLHNEFENETLLFFLNDTFNCSLDIYLNDNIINNINLHKLNKFLEYLSFKNLKPIQKLSKKINNQLLNEMIEYEYSLKSKKILNLLPIKEKNINKI